MLDQTQFLHGNRKATLFLLCAVLSGASAGALLIALSLIISEVVDRVFLRGQNLDAVTGLLVTAVVLALVRAALIWIEELFAQSSASSVKIRLRSQLIQKLMILGPNYVRRESSGELAHSLVDGIESLNDYFTQYLPAKTLALLIPILVFIVVLILDPWTTLVYIIAGPMLFLLLALIGGQTSVIQQRRFQEMSWMSAYFLDMLQGLPTLKMFGRSLEQVENIKEISGQYGKTTMEVLRTAFQTSLVLEWSATAATAMVALEVSFRLVNGSLPFNVALAVLLLTPEFFLPIRHYALRYHAGAQAKTVADRLTTVQKVPNPSHGSRLGLSTRSFAQTIPATADIHFEEVSVKYQDGHRLALSDFTLTIPNGRTIALVGPTGAGKSTVVNLLLRFVEPSAGSISAGDTLLSAYHSDIWHQQVTWVPQHPHLFYGTVSDNIRLAKPSATEDELVAASRAANAHDFILALPDGYDTHLGDRALRLSGGQRQRIAIARAFLKDAPLLIMDESTSYLDTRSELLIAESLQTLMQDRTTLIIAHRLVMAQKADQIIVLDNGRIRQTGTHEDLLSRKGLYRQLYTSYVGETLAGGLYS